MTVYTISDLRTMMRDHTKGDVLIIEGHEFLFDYLHYLIEYIEMKGCNGIHIDDSGIMELI